MEGIRAEIEPQLPKREPLKSELKAMTPPKLQFKKDGTPSKTCEKWFDGVTITLEGKWSGKKNEVWYPLPYHEPIITPVTMTLSNNTQIKEWLLGIGWNPLYWNYKTEKNKHGKRVKIRVNGKYVKSTPKLQENGKICPNLQLLGELEIVKPYLEWLTLRHRRSQIQGWLDNPRLEIDGRIGASASGLTNTKRQKHSVIVNVPRVTSILGEEMRGLFKVPEGKVLVGYDASSLEDRVKAHYLYSIDGGVLANKVIAGSYDPHQESADVWGMERPKAKNGNYALQYLCMPPTLAKTLGCSLEQAEVYHVAYWELNESLDEFVQQVKRAWAKNDKKFVRTIDRSKIYTRAEHSIANCVMQSTGAKVMDMSYAFMRKWIKEQNIPAKRVIYQHDEFQWETTPEFGEIVGELGRQSIIKAGELFKLNCPMDADYAISDSWAGTH